MARWREDARHVAAPLLTMLLLLVSLLLPGCGGGGGAGDGAIADGGTDPSPSPAPVSTPAPVVVETAVGPGRLVEAAVLKVIPAAEFAQALAAQGAAAPPLAAAYDVAAWRLTYLTVDVDGREITASGLLAAPAKGAGAASPLLSWQHGTLFHDAEAPSNALRPTEPALQLASAGYLVAAADYVGYGVTRGMPHPYLLSAPTAAAVRDLLVAVRTWRQRQGVAGNGQLFLAGYSEGGYATVAVHRLLEATATASDAVARRAHEALRSELVAVVPGAGPYHLAATLDALLEQIRDDNPVLAALIDPGFLRHLGSSVRNEVRRQLVRKLIPGDADVGFDTRFIDPFLDDHRDVIEQQSNVHDWAPQRTVRFFHGRDDRTVPYMSSTSTLQTMLVRGAPDVLLTDCRAVPAGHLECVPGFVAHVLAVLGERVRGL